MLSLLQLLHIGQVLNYQTGSNYQTPSISTLNHDQSMPETHTNDVLPKANLTLKMTD